MYSLFLSNALKRYQFSFIDNLIVHFLFEKHFFKFLKFSFALQPYWFFSIGCGIIPKNAQLENNVVPWIPYRGIIFDTELQVEQCSVALQ